MSAKDTREPKAIISATAHAQRLAERILKLRAEVAKRHAEIAELEEELADCVGNHSYVIYSDGSRKRLDAPAQAATKRTQAERVLGVLWTQPGVPFTSTGVAVAIGSNNPESVRQVLNALQRAGKISKMGRGKWGAVPTKMREGTQEKEPRA